jgi:hypothetical protein
MIGALSRYFSWITVIHFSTFLARSVEVTLKLMPGTAAIREVVWILDFA